jgi:hypothetical protein
MGTDIAPYRRDGSYRLPAVRLDFRPTSAPAAFSAINAFQTHLERRERHIDTVLAEARQNQLVDLVAQRHTVPHFGGVDTQLENLDPLLQVDEERFRRRVSITSEQRWRRRSGSA